jgi:hypothetical protein
MKAGMIIAVCMMVGSAAFAQRHETAKGDHAVGHLERMKKSLTLTADQETKIKALEEQFGAAHKKLKADTALSVGTWHNKMNKLKTDHQASLKQVLTEAQWTQWTSGKGNHRGGAKGRHRHGRGHRG